MGRFHVNGDAPLKTGKPVGQMMKKEIRRWLFAAGSLLALATGCQAKQYEKVSIPKYPNTLEQREGTGWEQGKGQPPEIVISEQDSPEIVVEGIPRGRRQKRRRIPWRFCLQGMCSCQTMC